MKGYKVFNSDWTCRGYQYEVGKTYEMAESPKCYEMGFHFCKRLVDCFNYYNFDPNNKVAEIEAIGEIDFDDTNSKCCTNKIVILKELTWAEVLDMCNTGKGNSGKRNSGNYNSGDYNCGDSNSGNYNSGHCNSGHHNTGDYNSGENNSGGYNSGNYNSADYNSGHYNSGHHNTGDGNCGNYNSRENNCGDYNCGDSNSGNYNSGHCNSGHHNTGDYNSGHYNSGNHNSGYCNTNTPKVRMFNHVTDFDFDDKTITRFENILFNCPQSYKYSDFISISDMSEDEIIRHPECKIIGGYVKTIIFEVDKQKWWDERVSDDDKKFIKSLPYFDAEIFYECVGIRIK